MCGVYRINNVQEMPVHCNALSGRVLRRVIGVSTHSDIGI